MSDENKYDLPWTVETDVTASNRAIYNKSDKFVANVSVQGLSTEADEEHATRLVRCVNLLRLVPDDAPCFRPQKSFGVSDEVQLALAVLQGDFGAAAALADLVVEKYQRPEPPPASKAPTEVTAPPPGKLPIREYLSRVFNFSDEQIANILEEMEQDGFQPERP
jgi:hypothetical protein